MWWVLAYAIAGTQEPRGVETTFRFMVLVPLMFVAFWWSVVVVVVLLIRVAVGKFAPRWWWCVSIVATLANLTGVMGLYGYTAQYIGGEGWPETSLALGSLLIAGVVSLAPIAWCWRRVDGASDHLSADRSLVPA
jgi:hypothetical protein